MTDRINRLGWASLNNKLIHLTTIAYVPAVEAELEVPITLRILDGSAFIYELISKGYKPNYYVGEDELVAECEHFMQENFDDLKFHGTIVDNAF